MSSTKRTVIEISSDEDEDNPFVTRRKIRRLHREAQQEVNPEIDQDSFTEFLENALPTNLIPPDVTEYLERESNIRLDIARDLGITLDEIYIDDDCLPTWSGMQWDSEVQSLHNVIQSRLLNLAVSEVLDPTFRRDFIRKANDKLEEARRLGINLRDITIGNGLLATWELTQEDDEMESDMGINVEESLDSDFTDEEFNTPIQLPFNPDAQTDNCFLTPDTSSHESRSPVDSTTSSPYRSGDLVSSESESDIQTRGENEEYDGVFTLHNALNPQPFYSIEDDLHVLNDVEIVGGADGYSDVDLEFYLAEDEENIEELAEIEFAIDGDGFQYYFGDSDEDVVEVEIPGMALQCSLDISKADEDEKEDEEKDHQYLPLFQENELETMSGEDEDAEMDDAKTGGGDADMAGKAMQIVADESDVSEEDGDAGIQVTEEGFKW